MKIKRAITALSLSATALTLGPVVVAQEQVLEEIVVTGIRASLRASADLKRNDSRIIDAIVAEDIGKLPDNNVAEALQRVTGISINREFGVGNEVSIRGLPQNRVEINGRTTLGDDRNGISFDDMPSAFLKSVEVIKSPTPEMIEGALGGTINMNTIRPSELTEQIIAGSLDMEYADKTENWAPIFNGTYGNNWDLDSGGSFGVVASLSYQDRELRQDTFQNDLRVQDGFDINNDGVIDAADEAQNTPSGNYVFSREHKFEPFVENRERTAFNITLEWAPSDRARVYLDSSYTEREGGEEAYSVLMAGGSPSNNNGQAYEDENGQLSNYSLDGAFILPKTWSEFRSTETFSHALGGEFDFTDKLTVSFEYSMAESDQTEPKSELNFRAHDQVAEALPDAFVYPNAGDPPAIPTVGADADPADFAAAQAAYNAALAAYNAAVAIQGQACDPTFDGAACSNQIAGAALQNLYTHDSIIDASSHNSVPGVTFVGDGDIYLNQDILALREFRHITDDEVNSEDAFRVDFEFSNPGDLDWFTAVKAGVRVTDREYERNRAEMRYANLHQNLMNAAETEFIVITMPEFDALNPGTLVTPYSSGDLFDQAGYTSANATAPFRLYNAELLSGDLEGTFQRIQAMLDGTNMQIDGSFADNLTPNIGSFALIEEDTTAFYLQADLDFDAARVVFGGRYVETDVTSTAYQDGELVADSQTYGDFLPSINVSIDLTDDTILRASGAKVMRRADFDKLSPAFDLDSDLATGERGNPGLEPFRATQFDFGVEHYFGGGDMVSATLFYKDVASFLKTSQYCAYAPEIVVDQGAAVGQFERACIFPVGVMEDSAEYFTTDDQAEYLDFVAQGRNGITTSTETNGANGSIQGFELGAVYTFDQLPGAWSGLGINANYTFAQSEDPNGLSLEDISENSYNIQLFWENEDWSARLAWTSRDRFLDETQEKRTEHIGELLLSNDIDLEADPTQGNSFRDGIDQLDVSASWAFNDSLTFVGSITNLTGEPIINSSVTGTAWQVEESDRRFSLGARFTF